MSVCFNCCYGDNDDGVTYVDQPPPPGESSFSPIYNQPGFGEQSNPPEPAGYEPARFCGPTNNNYGIDVYPPNPPEPLGYGQPTYGGRYSGFDVSDSMCRTTELSDPVYRTPGLAPSGVPEPGQGTFSSNDQPPLEPICGIRETDEN